VDSLVSWPALGIATIAYWILVVAVVRRRGRLNISQIIAALLIGPVALLLIRLVALGGLR
jgi:hypothetical protein